MKMISIVLTLVMALSGSAYAAQRTFKLTTYYPAPYGEYKQVKAKTLEVGTSAVPGSLKIVDGKQANGNVLTSDADGNASWKSSSGGSSGWVRVRGFATNYVECAEPQGALKWDSLNFTYVGKSYPTTPTGVCQAAGYASATGYAMSDYTLGTPAVWDAQPNNAPAVVEGQIQAFMFPAGNGGWEAGKRYWQMTSFAAQDDDLYIQCLGGKAPTYPATTT